MQAWYKVPNDQFALTFDLKILDPYMFILSVLVAICSGICPLQLNAGVGSPNSQKDFTSFLV